MFKCVPRQFQFKMAKIFPSQQIVNGELLDGGIVRTFFHNGYMMIEKFMTYREACDQINDGVWDIIWYAE